jgi:hypothetical protein
MALQKWGTPKKLPIRKTSEKTGGFGDTGRPCFGHTHRSKKMMQTRRFFALCSALKFNMTMTILADKQWIVIKVLGTDNSFSWTHAEILELRIATTFSHLAQCGSRRCKAQ